MKYVLNFGGGVNSTALFFELIRRKEPLDLVIFADTGSEMPATYRTLELISNICFKKEILMKIVVSKYDKPIFDYYFDLKTIPFRKFRDCTDKFKKLPINKFIKQFKEEGVTQYIGIALEEKHRAEGHKSSKWIFQKYPLIEWGIDRKKCIEIIKENNFPIPVKSGCFFCPFQPQTSWKKLYFEQPIMFDLAMLMEKQNRTYKKGNTLIWKGTLEQLKKAINEQKTLNFDNCGGVCIDLL